MRTEIAIVAVLMGVMSSPAYGANTPRMRADDVIRYEQRSNTNIRGRQFLAFFTPRLRAAIESDMSGQHVGALDYDPFCQCQDSGGLHMRVASINRSGPTAIVRLQVRFARPARPSKTSVWLELRRTQNSWKVADIRTREVPSLLRRLEAQ